MRRCRRTARSTVIPTATEILPHTATRGTPVRGQSVFIRFSLSGDAFRTGSRSSSKSSSRFASHCRDCGGVAIQMVLAGRRVAGEEVPGDAGEHGRDPAVRGPRAFASSARATLHSPHTKIRISLSSRNRSRISAAFSKSRFFAASFISFDRRLIALSRSSPSARSSFALCPGSGTSR